LINISICFGRPLKGIDKGEQLKHLPRYARKEEGEFPEWKKKYIRNNRNFYKKHKICRGPSNDHSWGVWFQLS
jgi:hypothetical protein